MIFINQLAELLDTEFKSFLQCFLVAGNVLLEQDKIITPQITAENRRLVHMQTITNGIQRVSRYCRRAGTNNRLTFQLADKIANVQISITERITPFRNAVTLVRHDHKNIRMLYSFNKRIVLQPFGSDIEKVQFLLTNLVQYLIYLLFRASHIDIIGRNAMIL